MCFFSIKMTTTYKQKCRGCKEFVFMNSPLDIYCEECKQHKRDYQGKYADLEKMRL